MDTIRLPHDFKEFLRLLNAHEIRYLLIGGYAVNAFGYSRNTGDIDIWIDSDSENQRKTIEAIRDFGFANVPDGMLDEPDAMLRMGQPPLRIEVLKQISGVIFKECWERRAMTSDGDTAISMISLEDLLANKRASGRPGDLVDVAELT